MIQKETLQFLKALASHNNRDWFQQHQPAYEAAKANMTAFADALLSQMHHHDQLETTSGKKSLYRIYRDVRFSKEKTPYQTHFGGYFRRQKPWLRGGYYFWIQPGNKSGIACGFTNPSAEDLQKVRRDMQLNTEEWRKVLGAPGIRRVFGPWVGSTVKTAPRGFEKDDPAIDLVRYKNWLFERTFTDAEVLSPGFARLVNNSFKAIRPFFDLASDVLGTDANGEALNRSADFSKPLL